jgi:ABC-type amino acid transport substrate-binding protein
LWNSDDPGSSEGANDGHGGRGFGQLLGGTGCWMMLGRQGIAGGAMLLGTRMWTTAALSVLMSAAAAADKLDDVRARGKLMVGVSDTTPPFSFRKPGEATVTGYDIDLVKGVAKRMAGADRDAALDTYASPLDTYASPDVWSRFADFYQRAAAASKIAFEASRARRADDFKARIVDLRAACNSCHAAYQKVD